MNDKDLKFVDSRKVFLRTSLFTNIEEFIQAIQLLG